MDGWRCVSVAMVVLHFNIRGVLTFPRKGDPPVSRDPNRNAPNLIVFQSMKARTTEPDLMT
ncbi:hypothetical protein EMEDMD4_270216 [Sinorhizobium medicae]|uniref:Uncharacterized protein n=1 Tax=Sinorhizobium medicae TaxID=110321 RepID=A0A508WV62_9HYPH|nr:hypothetical protein EMEDMD4_270216 [Sinorhizobium medicae]